mgnify:FL=1
MDVKNKKGITLIALVITIIVLLILAGVAIAMLSGENGILRKAADAKTQTEQAQKEEETTLKDMELTTYFSTKNMRYKCRNGYMTGFNWWEDEKVEKLETALKPLEYKINMKYDVNEKKDVPIENKSDTPVATGMLVEDKNGEPVARIVVFGDINCDGDLTGDDYSKFLRHVYNTEKLEEDFIKVAMDLNFDNKINAKDLKLSREYYLENVDIPQSQYTSDPNKIIVDMESCLRYRYVETIRTNDVYTLEYDEATDRYNFKMKTSEATKVEDLLKILPANGKIKRNGEEVAATENVQNGDEVVYVNNEKETNVGKIIIE